jgi:hypothetical protein
MNLVKPICYKNAGKKTSGTLRAALKVTMIYAVPIAEFINDI